MTVTHRDYLAQKEYYKDQMRAAQRYHLTCQARSERNGEHRTYTQAFAWLRRRLAAWRTRPQERYDTVAPSALPQPQ
jgi:hypothetical protein